MESKSKGILKTLSALREDPSFKVPRLYKDLGYGKPSIEKREREREKFKQFFKSKIVTVCAFI